MPNWPNVRLGQSRTLPANALGEFVRSLAHRIARFPAGSPCRGQGPRQRDRARAGRDFRRDSDLFGEGARSSEAEPLPSRVQAASRPEMRKWIWLDYWATWATPDLLRKEQHAIQPERK